MTSVTVDSKHGRLIGAFIPPELATKFEGTARMLNMPLRDAVVEALAMWLEIRALAETNKKEHV